MAQHTLSGLAALLVLLAAFIMAISGTMTWLMAAMFMGLAVAILLLYPRVT